MHAQQIFGSSEFGPVLISPPGHGPEAQLLQPAEKHRLLFEPYNDVVQTFGIHNDEQVLQLAIPEEHPRYPHVTLRRGVPGPYYTGDLFTQPMPGFYRFCGRTTDWIKNKDCGAIDAM